MHTSRALLQIKKEKRFPFCILVLEKCPGADGQKRKVKKMIEGVYICNPLKNKNCNQNGCKLFGGDCYLTMQPENAITNKNGQPILYNDELKKETEEVLEKAKQEIEKRIIHTFLYGGEK